MVVYLAFSRRSACPLHFVILMAPQFWICFTCKLSPRELSETFSFLVLEWAGPWHSLPNPDFLGFPTPMVSPTCEPPPGTREQKQAAHLGAPGFQMGTFSQRSSGQLKKICRW